jgi:glycerophosphoryl diester phosphodiesterase
MRAASLLTLVVVALAGCDRPNPLLVCHNANCVEPTKPEEDDTLPALRASLALSIGGLPAVDGTEIDTFLRATDGACLFAHDLEGARSTVASEAADELASYIASTTRLTHSGRPFRIFIELKPRTDAAETEKHTPAQRTMHADCVWDVYNRIAAAAVANAREVEIVFASFNPDLLREMIARQPIDTPIPFLYDAFYGIPKPLDSVTQPLSDYAGIPIELVEIHPQWIHDAQWEGLLSQNVEVLFWTFSATVETFAAIEQYEPDWVGTSEANLMRRWLEY